VWGGGVSGSGESEWERRRNESEEGIFKKK
jgi:hypothetical protein